MEECYDVLIIGAGPSGLCAAKTFLECEPDVRIGLIDSNNDVGGVWATRQLYPGLKTNNVHGMLDFTDFPMDKSFGVQPGEHVPGEVMHDYLVVYAQKWDILRRIMFSTVVSTIERDDSNLGWKLSVMNMNDSSNVRTLCTKKLVVATGLTNEPHRPMLPGQDDFEAPILHSVDLGREIQWLNDPNISTVTVLGGGKSAYDAVYLAACAAKKVEWIIRKSGKGPAWIFPPKASLGPFKALREKLVLRRLISCFSPCILTSTDGFGWLRYFLHRTKIGLLISKQFWVNIGKETLEDCGYRHDPVLNVLEPEQSPFWYGTATGTYSYKTNFSRLIKAGRVHIHREDISHLSPHTVHLASESSTSVASDLMIAATGFTVRPTFNFKPASLAADLGLPVTTASLTPKQAETWSKLDAMADQHITQVFPRLTAGPFHSPTSQIVKAYNPGAQTPTSDLSMTPYRLYRCIAPPSLTIQGDRSLAFIGYMSNIAGTIRLEVQCLWAYAYLTHDETPTPMSNGHIASNGSLTSHPSSTRSQSQLGQTLLITPATVLPTTALLSRYARHRAPYGHGKWYPDLNFDQMPFIDMLMRDLGLPVLRKKYWRWFPWSPWRWVREAVEPYGQAEYRGIVREWLEGRRRRYGHEMKGGGKAGI